MNGPHGLYLMDLNPNIVTKVYPPFEVIEKIGDTSVDEGIRTVFFVVVDQADMKQERNILANAFCDFVEFDYATRDAAAQFLLDMCNVKYGG